MNLKFNFGKTMHELIEERLLSQIFANRQSGKTTINAAASFIRTKLMEARFARKTQFQKITKI